MKKRPELRLVVSSATLDAEEFFKFFNTNESGDPQKDTASILSVEGRMYHVGKHNKYLKEKKEKEKRKKKEINAKNVLFSVLQ